MKISDQDHNPTPSVVPVTSNGKTDKTASKTKVDNKVAGTASRSATENAFRIQSFFARVGVTPLMVMPDEAARQQAIKRRNDILALSKIRNLQAIMDVATSVGLTETSEESVDPDWFYAFSQLAENIYSPAMQSLWGKILAVEVSKPGSFSLRSLETLKVMTQRDAALFSRAASLSSIRQGDTEPRIIVGYHQKRGFWSFLGQRQPESLNLASFGLSYPDLLALTDMKLIYGSEIESGELDQLQSIKWRCGSDVFTVTPRRPGLAFVYYKFTSTGSELTKLISRQNASHYVAALHHCLSSAFAIE